MTKTVSGYASFEPEWREVLAPGSFTAGLGFDPAAVADIVTAIEAGDITPLTYPPK